MTSQKRLLEYGLYPMPIRFLLSVRNLFKRKHKVKGIPISQRYLFEYGEQTK